MSEALGVALMALVGAQLAPQAPINRGLSHRVGGLAAAFVNFAVGGVVIFAVCAAAGKLGGVWGVWHAPPGDAAGGLLGAGFVLLALLCVGSIGASGVAAATVTGQLIASLALDATGALGLERRAPTVPVLLGALAVLAGTLLILPREQSVPGHGKAPGLARLGPGATMIFGGALLGVQHPLNGQLAGSIGDLPSSVVNFAVGAGALLAVLACFGQAPQLTRLTRVPRHLLAGGVFGAVNVTMALTMVDRIGAGALAAATVTGQLIASLALDRAGLLGLRPHPVTRRRAAGALLLIAGTILVAI